MRTGMGQLHEPRNVAHAELLVLGYMLRCYKTARNTFAEAEDSSLLVVRVLRAYVCMHSLV